MKDTRQRNSPFLDPCSSNALWLAQHFNEAAKALGSAIDTLEAMAARDWDAVNQEASAADRIVIEGREVERAMRAFAMRLDRGAFLNEDAD